MNELTSDYEKSFKVFQRATEGLKEQMGRVVEKLGIIKVFNFISNVKSSRTMEQADLEFECMELLRNRHHEVQVGDEDDERHRNTFV